MDIVILLLCAFFIINRLMKILGQYDPESDRARREKSPFVKQEMQEVKRPQVFSEEELLLPEAFLSSLGEIKLQDPDFFLEKFLEGAKKAFLLLHKALLEGKKDEIEFLLDSDCKEPQGEIIKSIEKIDLIDLALYGDRVIATIELKTDQERNFKLAFSRYLTQDKNWKIIKYQKLDKERLASPENPVKEKKGADKS